MTNSTVRVATGLCLLLTLAACGSTPPSKFYRLTPVAGLADGGQHPALGIGPIDIPEFLDRDALVYSSGGNQLQVVAGERWAEPLEDGIQRVVGLNLARLLQSENLHYYPWDPRQDPDYGISLRVLDLDATDRQATLVVDWLLYRPASGETVSKQISQFSEPLPQAVALAPAELPRAYSALLYQLSETIAAAIHADRGAD